MKPAIATYGAASDTNNNFVEADYSLSTGLTGNKSSKYLATGLTPNGSGLAASSAAMFVYMTGTTTNDATGCCQIGAYEGGRHFGLYLRNGTGNLGKQDTLMNSFTAYWGGQVPKDYKGFFGFSTVGSQLMSYRNGAGTNAATAAVGATLCFRPLYVMARNNIGVTDQYSGGSIGAYVVSDGLSASECKTLYELMQTFQTSLGRAYSPSVTDISCWGDSLTPGVVTLMQEALFSSGQSVRQLGVGGETSTQVKTRLLADPAGKSGINIIWVGTNNITATSTVLADVADMVADLDSSEYIIVTPLPNIDSTDWIGGADRAAIEATIDGLLDAYPNNSFDALTYLQGYGTGTGQDATDVTNGIVPSSLRDGTLHLNTGGSNRMSIGLRDFITAKGW